ncbi:hypothetical protein ACTA71_005416 [Dictyostelium dimigraforme]
MIIEIVVKLLEFPFKRYSSGKLIENRVEIEVLLYSQDDGSNNHSLSQGFGRSLVHGSNLGSNLGYYLIEDLVVILVWFHNIVIFNKRYSLWFNEEQTNSNIIRSQQLFKSITVFLIDITGLRKGILVISKPKFFNALAIDG